MPSLRVHFSRAFLACADITVTEAVDTPPVAPSFPVINNSFAHVLEDQVTAQKETYYISLVCLHFWENTFCMSLVPQLFSVTRNHKSSQITTYARVTLACSRLTSFALPRIDIADATSLRHEPLISLYAF